MSNKTSFKQVGISIGLFLLALSPRIVGLQRLVTADEAKWIYRSAQFWLAVLQGKWEHTIIEPVKPAVTTMWSGGLGMWVYNRLHEQRPLVEFLESIPQWDVDPRVLQAMRNPTILLACASIVLIYHLAKPLLGDQLALLATGLLSLDPYFVGHSRFLHHDALATIAVIPSLLFAIHASKDSDNRKALIGSAVFAGLAFLAKSSSLVLIPFVGLLFLFTAWRHGQRWINAIGRCTVWLVLAYLTFVALWPAAWVRPIGTVASMIHNALQESKETSTIIVLPNLGPFYYLVYLAFYITPVVLIGLGMWLWQRNKLPSLARYTTHIIAAFGTTFLIFMTFSTKRGARYILPSFVTATLVAASGWHAWLGQKTQRTKRMVIIGLFAIQLLSVIPYAPYYISYLNPLLGGPLTAPHIIRIGWGEGMDQVGAWLNQLSNAENLIVGTSYRSTLNPYFMGRLHAHTSGQTDCTVIYVKHKFTSDITTYAYYEAMTPVATFNLAGVEYANIYAGPAVQMLNDNESIIAYRLHNRAFALDQEAEIDLIWRSPEEVPESMPPFSLRQDTQDVWLDGATVVSQHMLESGTMVTRHTLPLSADGIEARPYILFLGEQPLGLFTVE